MPDQLVVHCKRENFDVYIGRPAKPVPHHYGNPFSNRGGTKAAEVVGDPVQAFDAWLSGTYRPDLEPERRHWIVANLVNLKDKRLGCWCVTPENPDAECHGWVLARRAMEGAGAPVVYYGAPARATDSTDTPVAHFERNGKRVHLACILGADLEEATRLQARLHELKRAAGI